MPINGWLSWTSKLGNGCRFRSVIFLSHLLSFALYHVSRKRAENQLFATRDSPNVVTGLLLPYPRLATGERLCQRCFVSTLNGTGKGVMLRCTFNPAQDCIAGSQPLPTNFTAGQLAAL